MHLSKAVPLLLAASTLLSCPERVAPPPPPPAKPVLSKPEVPAGPTAEEQLKALAEQLRNTCAAEFARAGSENLVAGSQATDCDPGEKPDWNVRSASARANVQDLAAAMGLECADLQKELELAVKRAGPGLPARHALEDFQRVVLVGFVYDKNKKVFPELKKDAMGNPTSFVPGLMEGVGYLYSVRTGKLLCAARARAASSEHIKTPMLTLVPGKAAKTKATKKAKR